MDPSKDPQSPPAYDYSQQNPYGAPPPQQQGYYDPNQQYQPPQQYQQYPQHQQQYPQQQQGYYNPNQQYQPPAQPQQQQQQQPYQELAPISNQQQPQQPNYAGAIYPSKPLLATTHTDESKWPKSAKLYNEMNAKFGPNANIVPPPDWLTNDKARVHWLKRDQNALLYFFHRKDKYKGEVQKILDKPLCLHGCCGYPGAGQYDEQGGCMFCCMEVLTYCCCSFVSSSVLQFSLSPDKAAVPSGCGPGCCLPWVFCCCTDGIKFRQKFVKRVNKAGVRYDEGSFCSWCKLACCVCCVSQQMANTLQYISQKRYGVLLVGNLQREMNDMKKESNEWREFMEDTKRAQNHPYSRCDFKQIQQTKNNTFIHIVQNRREKVESVGKYPTRPFLEYYKPQVCIDEHNRYWRGIHTIGAINMG